MLERSVIIVAGGRGLRMGQDIPKQFIPVGGRPVLMHTMEQFYGYNESMEIILVLPEDQFSYWKALCRKYDFQVRHQLIRGGETRYHSVKNGLDAVSGQMVAVHDGVRPFVTPETIERCFIRHKNTAPSFRWWSWLILFVKWMETIVKCVPDMPTEVFRHLRSSGPLF